MLSMISQEPKPNCTYWKRVVICIEVHCGRSFMMRNFESHGHLLLMDFLLGLKQNSQSSQSQVGKNNWSFPIRNVFFFYIFILLCIVQQPVPRKTEFQSISAKAEKQVVMQLEYAEVESSIFARKQPGHKHVKKFTINNKHDKQARGFPSWQAATQTLVTIFNVLNIHMHFILL